MLAAKSYKGNIKDIFNTRTLSYTLDLVDSWREIFLYWKVTLAKYRWLMCVCGQVKSDRNVNTHTVFGAGNIGCKVSIEAVRDKILDKNFEVFWKIPAVPKQSYRQHPQPVSKCLFLEESKELRGGERERGENDLLALSDKDLSGNQHHRHDHTR